MYVKLQQPGFFLRKNGPIKRVPDGAVVYASRLGRRCAPALPIRASASMRPRRTRSQLNDMKPPHQGGLQYSPVVRAKSRARGRMPG